MCVGNVFYASSTTQSIFLSSLYPSLPHMHILCERVFVYIVPLYQSEKLHITHLCVGYPCCAREPWHRTSCAPTPGSDPPRGGSTRDPQGFHCLKVFLLLRPVVYVAPARQGGMEGEKGGGIRAGKEGMRGGEAGKEGRKDGGRKKDGQLASVRV